MQEQSWRLTVMIPFGAGGGQVVMDSPTLMMGCCDCEVN